jgi:signal transduction histidine kinase
VHPLLQRIAGHAGNKLGRRFAVLILVFSSIVTLVSTVLQLGLEYRQDLSDIDILLRQIRSSYSESLASSMWITSSKDLQLQLNGILRLPDMQYLEVRNDQGQVVATAGQARSNRVVEQTFPLLYNHRGAAITIGQVRTVANLDGVYARLRAKIIVILITQTIKTFLVSLFILMLFHVLVGRHLNRIAAYSNRASAGVPDTPLVLDRLPGTGSEGDELDIVVGALNAMRARLEVSFNNLRASLAEAQEARAALRSANDSMEAQVRERTAQLEAANKELEAFSYSVSHDLRSPLRGIDGWSLALQEDYAAQLDATGRQYLDRVRSESQRMGRLIDDMLQFSRLGRTAMSSGPVDLTALARGIAGRIGEAQPGRALAFAIEDGLETVGDWRLLEVVLTNLLENAVKFTRGRDPAQIAVGCTKARDPASGDPVDAWFVRDNGAGFDMQYAGKLFGVFQRLHGATEFPGTGIGLATVQRIVQRHGGRVWAEAAVGAGATFYFTLKEQAR